MKSKHNSGSPGQHRTEDAAWAISAETRQDAQAADACMGPDDWAYGAASPFPGTPPLAEPKPATAQPALAR